MNIKTKILISPDDLKILKENLQYSKIKVLEMKVHKDYASQPRDIKDYIYNQIIFIIYHLLVDNEEIYMTIIKKGIHMDGTYDSKTTTIFRDDLEVLYSNRKVNNIKKKRKY